MVVCLRGILKQYACKNAARVATCLQIKDMLCQNVVCEEFSIICFVLITSYYIVPYVHAIVILSSRCNGVVAVHLYTWCSTQITTSAMNFSADFLSVHLSMTCYHKMPILGMISIDQHLIICFSTIYQDYFQASKHSNPFY